MAKKKRGLLFGVLLGTALGVLFAPVKGRKLRGEFIHEIKDGGLGTKTFTSNFRKMGGDFIDAARETYKNPDLQKKMSGGEEQLKKAALHILRLIRSALKRSLTNKPK